jgi:hypothetical protein
MTVVCRLKIKRSTRRQKFNWECSDMDVFDGQPCIFGNLVDEGVGVRP